MKIPKDSERIHIRVTPEQKNQIQSMADKSHMCLSHYMIDRALKTHPYSPLYTKETHDFLLNLDAMLHSLSSYSLTDKNADNLRQELYEEAKSLWQSLKFPIEYI